MKEQEAKEKEPSAKIIFARPQQSKITFPRPDKDKAQDKDQERSARITFRKGDAEMRTPASYAASKDNTKPSHKPIYARRSEPNLAPPGCVGIKAKSIEWDR